MMNLTRGEDFTVEVTLDMGVEEYESLELSIVQNEKRILLKGKADAEPAADGERVYFTFSSFETLHLWAGIPAFARARGTLPGGVVMSSEVEEICVLDPFGAGKEELWN